MAKSLLQPLRDEYSAYIVSKEASDFSEDTTGTYGGIELISQSTTLSTATLVNQTPIG